MLPSFHFKFACISPTTTTRAHEEMRAQYSPPKSKDLRRSTFGDEEDSDFDGYHKKKKRKRRRRRRHSDDEDFHRDDDEEGYISSWIQDIGHSLC